MRLFTTWALLTQIWVGSAQVYFNTQIDWEQHFEYYSGMALGGSSNNIFLAGGAGALSSPENFSVFASLSPDGNLLWQKNFLPKPGLYGETYHLAKISDKFAVLLGNYLVPTSAADFDGQIYLSKINLETGDTIWTKELGLGNFNEQGWTIMPTNDGGIILCGSAYKNTGTRNKMLLIKTDSLGNQLFRKEYSTDINKGHFSFSVATTLDNGYFILGYRNYTGPYLGGNTTVNNVDMVFINVDAQGNLLSVKIYPPWEWLQNLFYGRDIQPLSDGTYIVAAGKGYALFQPANTFSAKYFLAKVSGSGAIIDSITLPEWHELCRINRLKPASDGNFWAIGAEKDTEAAGQTGLIMKITPDLDVLWKREYRVSLPESTLHDMFYEGVEMPDHGFVLCGTAFGPLEDSTYQNGWVIRVDSLGCLEPGCHTNVGTEEPAETGSDITIDLSPNPTSGLVRLSLKQNDAVLLGVQVFDMQGRMLQHIQFLRNAGWRDCDLDLSGEAAGVYFVRVRTSAGSLIRKVAVE